jgi:hypothetical protein
LVSGAVKDPYLDFLNDSNVAATSRYVQGGVLREKGGVYNKKGGVRNSTLKESFCQNATWSIMLYYPVLRSARTSTPLLSRVKHVAGK